MALGALGATGLAAFYAGIVGGVGGLTHLGEQAASDWPWLALILAGFGTQIALLVELRRRRRAHHGVTAAAGAGGGASAAGMIACCAHHIADLAPIIGASGAAVFLTGYRVPIMLTGVVINAAGVLISARRLRGLSRSIAVGG
jgi:hypothetical protein